METPFECAGVRGTLHEPESPSGDGVILTHGAGSNSNAPLLVHLARSFADAGWFVLRYDLPFRQQRPKGPPFPAMAPRDREGVVHAAEAMRKLAHGRLIAGGHSYGGRQTAMTTAAHHGLADTLLLLSYPLHPPAKPERKRTDYFPQLRTPALFVHGTSDPFGSVEELREAIALIPARTDLVAVEGAGHDLKRASDLSADLIARLHALV